MSWYKKSITQQDIEEFTRPKWIPVDSSFIAFVAYYKPLQIFEVKMKNGKEYTFNKVPEFIYEGLMLAPSKGEFFNRVIKNRYPQQKDPIE